MSPTTFSNVVKGVFQFAYTAFLAAYRACRNRDKALAAIGKGPANYRESANWILRA